MPSERAETVHSERLTQLEAEAGRSTWAQAELYRMLLWNGPATEAELADAAPSRISAAAVENNLTRLAERGWARETADGWAIVDAE